MLTLTSDDVILLPKQNEYDTQFVEIKKELTQIEKYEILRYSPKIYTYLTEREALFQESIMRDDRWEYTWVGSPRKDMCPLCIEYPENKEVVEVRVTVWYVPYSLNKDN